MFGEVAEEEGALGAAVAFGAVRRDAVVEEPKVARLQRVGMQRRA